MWEPILIFSDNAESLELGTKVKESLNSSKTIRFDDFKYSTKEFVKLLRESSLKKLYTSSTSCYIFLENNSYTIKPNRLIDIKFGLEEVSEDVQKISSEVSTSDLGALIAKVLMVEY